jgi:hypothetical protein
VGREEGGVGAEAWWVGGALDVDVDGDVDGDVDVDGL